MLGTSSTTVMFRKPTLEPPLLLPQTMYAVVFHNSVGVPQIVPLLVSKVKPLGSAGLISHEVIAPAPVSTAFSGRSLLV